MILERIASVGTAIEIPTLALDFSPHIRLSLPNISKTEAPVSNTSSRLSTPSTAPPTYFQVRNAYHELKVPTRRDPLKMLSILHTGAAWLSDMHRHSGLPSSLHSRLPIRSFLPQPPPTLPESQQAIALSCPSRMNGEPLTHANAQCTLRALNNITTPKLDPTCDEEAPVFDQLWLSEGVPRNDNAVARRACRTSLRRLPIASEDTFTSRRSSDSIKLDTLSSYEASIATSILPSLMASSLTSYIQGEEEEEEADDNTF